MNESHVRSFWSRLLDIIAPRACCQCHRRLAIDEEVLCASCLLHLPRTFFATKALDNPMARLLWGQLAVERVAALFYYEPSSELTRAIHQLKYRNRPDIGIFLGRLMAEEMMGNGFFEGVDLLVPVPLTKERQRERGYNQSLMLAKGVSEKTGIPIAEAVVVRTKFSGSQTHRHAWERRENVEHAFEYVGEVDISGKHLMLIDDVLTTGATIINCGKPLAEQQNVTISVLTAGFTKS